MKDLVEQIDSLHRAGYETEAFATYEFAVSIVFCLLQQKNHFSIESFDKLIDWAQIYGEQFIQKKHHNAAGNLYRDIQELCRELGFNEEMANFAEHLAQLESNNEENNTIKRKQCFSNEILPVLSIQKLEQLLEAFAHSNSGKLKEFQRREAKITQLLAEYAYGVSRVFMDQAIQESLAKQDLTRFATAVQRHLAKIDEFLQATFYLQTLLSFEDLKKPEAEINLGSLLIVSSSIFTDQLKQIREWYALILVYIKPGGFPNYNVTLLINAYINFNNFFFKKNSNKEREPIWLSWRKKLNKSREDFWCALKEDNIFLNIHSHLEKFNLNGYQALLTDIMHYCLELLGEPPCQYAVLSMGSFARSEATPYSDIELLILVEKDDPASLNYFRTWIKVLDIYVRVLGESSETRNGFRLDIPFLLQGDIPFIGIPQKLVENYYNLTPDNKRFELGESHSLLTVSWVFGNSDELLDSYRQKLISRLQQTLDLGLPAGKFYHQQVAAVGLRYDVGQYLKLLQEKDLPTNLSNWAVNIKARFVKPIVMVLIHLKVYFELPTNNPLEIVKQLAAEERFPIGLAEKIEEALALLQHIRCYLQRRACQQTEEVTLEALKGIFLEWQQQSYRLNALSNQETLSKWDIFTISREVIAPLHTLILSWLTIEESKPNLEGSWQVSAKDHRVYSIPSYTSFTSLTRYSLECHYFQWQLSQFLVPHSLKKYQFATIDDFNQTSSMVSTSYPVVLEWVMIDETHKVTIYHGQLRQEIADKLINQHTKLLNTHKRYPHANHPVHRLTLAEVDIHAKCYPELPGLEIAVYLLSHRLVGGGVPAMAVAKLTWQDDKGKSKTEPLLLSQTIAGLDGATVSQKFPEWYKHVEINNYFQQVLLTILTQPEDAKPDNFVLRQVLNRHGQLETQLISIDHDHAFQEPLVTVGKIRKQTVLQTKSVVYCLETMKVILPGMARQWPAISPYNSLRHWLKSCDSYDRGLRWLFTKEQLASYLQRVHTQQETQRTSLPILLESETIEQLYITVYRLQYHLNLAFSAEIHQDITHLTFLKLLHELQPLVALRYATVLDNHQTPSQRFDSLTKHAYSEITQGHHHSMRGNPQVRQSGLRVMPSKDEVLTRSQYSPDKCLVFLQEQLQQFQRQVDQAREALLARNPQPFLNLKYWYFQEQAISGITFPQPDINIPKANRKKILEEQKKMQQYLLVILLEVPGRWTQLQLAHWSALKEEHFKKLLIKHSELHTLDISACKKLEKGAFELLQRYGEKNLVTLRVRDTKITQLIPFRSGIIFYSLERIETLALDNCLELTTIELPRAMVLRNLSANHCPQLRKVSIQGQAIKVHVINCSALTTELLRQWVNDSTGIIQLRLGRGKNLAMTDIDLVEDYPMLLRLSEKMRVDWTHHYRQIETKLAKQYNLLIATPERGIKAYLSTQTRLTLLQTLQKSINIYEITLKQVIPKLLVALKDSEVSVRHAVAATLITLGFHQQEASQALLAELITEDDEKRAMIVNTLGKLQYSNEKIMNALLSAAKKEHLFVQCNAITALGNLGITHQEIITILENLLIGADFEKLLDRKHIYIKDSEWKIRYAAVRALHQLKACPKQVLTTLLEALTQKDILVREEAAYTIADLELKNEEVIQALIRVFKSDYMNLQLAAGSALYKLNVRPKQYLKVLVNAVTEDEVRITALRALGKLGDKSPEVLYGLLAELKNKDQYVRQEAVRALIALDHKEKEVIEGLLMVFGYESVPNVRIEMLRALSILGNGAEKLVQDLISDLIIVELTNTSVEIQCAAATALGVLGSKRKPIIDALNLGMHASNASLQIAAATALYKLGFYQEEVIQQLLSSLKAWREEVRSQAARALGELLNIAIIKEQLESHMLQLLTPSLKAIALSLEKKESNFLAGPKKDPHECLTPECLSYLFNWFDRKTFSLSRQVSKKWRVSVLNRDRELIEQYQLNKPEVLFEILIYMDSHREDLDIQNIDQYSQFAGLQLVPESSGHMLTLIKKEEMVQVFLPAREIARIAVMMDATRNQDFSIRKTN